MTTTTNPPATEAPAPAAPPAQAASAEEVVTWDYSPDMPAFPTLGTVMLIVGESGLGKTHIAATLRGPLVHIDTEDRADMVLKKFRNVYWKRAHDYPTIKAAMSFAIRTVKTPGTIIIDSASDLRDYVEEWVVEQLNASKKKVHPTFHWGDVYAEIQNMIGAVRSRGWNIVFTGRMSDEYVNDKKTGKREPGSFILNKVWYWSDYVLWLNKNEHGIVYGHLAKNGANAPGTFREILTFPELSWAGIEKVVNEPPISLSPEKLTGGAAVPARRSGPNGAVPATAPAGIPPQSIPTVPTLPVAAPVPAVPAAAPAALPTLPSTTPPAAAPKPTEPDATRPFTPEEKAEIKKVLDEKKALPAPAAEPLKPGERVENGLRIGPDNVPIGNAQAPDRGPLADLNDFNELRRLAAVLGLDASKRLEIQVKLLGRVIPKEELPTKADVQKVIEHLRGLEREKDAKAGVDPIATTLAQEVAKLPASTAKPEDFDFHLTGQVVAPMTPAEAADLANTWTGLRLDFEREASGNPVASKAAADRAAKIADQLAHAGYFRRPGVADPADIQAIEMLFGDLGMTAEAGWKRVIEKKYTDKPRKLNMDQAKAVRLSLAAVVKAHKEQQAAKAVAANKA